MKSLLPYGIVAAATLALSVGLRAQEPAKPAPKEHTMTGCLAKGATDGTYIVTNTD